MAKADLLKKFEEKILEAIDGIDEDSITEAIDEEVNWSELVKEVLKEDPDIKKRIRDKVAELIENQLENADDLGELVGDEDFSFLDHLPDGSEIGSLVTELLEQGQPLRKKFLEKLRDLITEKIEEASDFEELTGDEDFSWIEHLPDDFSFGKIIAELLESDEDLKKKLREEIKSLIENDIRERFDSDDLPDWDEILRLFGIEEVIRQLAKEDNELKEKLLKEIRSLIESKIENELDEDSLPEDFWKKIDLSAEVSLVMSDRDFRAQISNQLQTMIREFIMNTVQRGSLGSDLAEKVKENPEFNNLLARQVDDMMRNPELMQEIRNSVRERILSDPDVSKQIMTAVFDKVSRGIADKLLKSY